jgi:hypothetical protein
MVALGELNVTSRSFRRVAAALSLFAGALAAPQAKAIPAFAAQTGEPCAACHIGFPQLTAYGRLFKLQGYVAGGSTPTLKTYGPPRLQVFSGRCSEQSASTYPASEHAPGQDGDPRILILINFSATRPPFFKSGFQNAEQLSGHLSSTTRKHHGPVDNARLISNRSILIIPPRSTLLH